MRHFVRQFYRVAKRKIRVSPELPFLSALAFVLVPVQWMGAWIFAVGVHELSHYIALRLCGGSVTDITISCRGVVMETQALPLGKEAICAYAGPLCALSILLFSRYFPRTAICTLVLSAYNLLPVFPLDGGRGLGCLLRKILPEMTAVRVFSVVENTVLLGILLIALYSVFCLNLGLLPAVLAVLLLVRSKGIKFPCKKCRLGLQ